MKIFAFPLLTAVAVPQQPSFEEWAAKYGVNGEEIKVKYEANVAEINRLNALNTTAVFGANKFSGMSSEEFASMFLMDQGEPEQFDNSTFTHFESSESSESVASSIDWEARGGITPVKNQGSCGSCWAFAAVAAVEARHKILTGETLVLSEQQIVDCSGAGSCKHGSDSKALGYLDEHAACTSSSYPYRNKDGSCKSCSSSHVHVSKVTWNDKTESAMVSALQDGPVTIGINADSKFQHYDHGVLQGDDACHHNHIVLLVGYTSHSWKIKNSWGKDFGENGFVRFERGGSNCGKFGARSGNTKSIKLSSKSSRRRTSHQAEVMV